MGVKVSSAIFVPVFVALAATLGLPGGAVLAQDATVEEIVVTGSRIRREDLVGISPVTQLSAETIAQSGQVSLADFLQDIPSVTGGDFGAGVNNGTEGIATVSLRGLGPNRTLVLVNGQRPAGVSVDGIVDLNTLPTAVIDRIEVLRDGASTIYGSDAVAGVINIITKRRFDGLELGAQYDVTDESDGETWTAAITGGRSFDRGGFVLSAQYQDRAEIWQGDRRFSECPFGEENGQIVCAGSFFSYPPLFITATDGLFLVRDAETGAIRDFTGVDPDTYNYATTSYLATPQETWNVFGDAYYDLVPAGGFSSVTARLQVSLNNRESDQFLAPEATFWIPEVPANHPDNPFGDVLCAGNAAVGCNAPESVFVLRRLVETGGRASIQDADVWQVVAGLEGTFSNGWTWDLSFNHAEYEESLVETNRAITSRVNEILTPDDCALNPACPGLWNVFATDSLTPALQAYALASPAEDASSEMQVVQANLEGDIPALALPGGNAQWAAGLEHRSEEAESIPDPLAQAGEIYFFPAGISRGDYDVTEAYGEVRLPLLSGAPWAELLAVEASLRWSDYDFLDSGDTNAKFGIEWAPVEDLRFRAIYAEGFRAPNIAERFDPAIPSANDYTDPCANYTAPGVDPVVAANCAAEGLPADFGGGPQGQAVNLLQGNPDLQPEEAENVTLGLVLMPAALPDLVVTLDWFHIEIEDAIGNAGTQNIIDGCYQSPNFSSPLCSLILGPSAVGEAPSPTSPFRNLSEDISGIDLTNANLQTFTTSGVDFSASYGFDVTAGRVQLDLSGTWLDSYEFQAVSGSEVLQYAGRFAGDPYFGAPAAFPEWQGNLRAAFRQDAWGASWTLRYLDGVEDLEPSPAKLDNGAPTMVYHDVQGFLERGAVTLTAGVRNLFDRDPPYVTAYDDMNTLPLTYETAGRYYYLRAKVAF